MNSIFKLIQTILLITSLSMSSTTAKGSEDPFADKREMWEEHLLVASDWLVREGLWFYQINGKKTFNTKLFRTFGVAPYIPAYTKETYDYSGFGITLGGTYFDVLCYYRDTTPSGLYELWTIQTSHDPDYKKDDYTLFFYTKAGSFYGKRIIDDKSDVFKNEHIFEDGYKFKIPLDNKIIKDYLLKYLDK